MSAPSPVEQEAIPLEANQHEALRHEGLRDDTVHQAVPPAGGAPVKVLHLINGEHYAGAERVQDLLALRLANHGFQVGFACLKPDRYAGLRQSQAAPLVEVPMRGRADPRPIRTLARLTEREGYALLHSHTPRSALVGSLVAAWTGVPLVHHVHSQTDREIGRPWTRRLNTWTERFSVRRAGAVIAVSSTARAFALRQGIGADRVRVVPNGIPANDRLPDRRPPQDGWTLGTVALLRPRKGLEVLLEALAACRGAGLPVRLRVVGPFESDQYRAEIDGRVARLGLEGSVEWTGFSREVPAELARMDLFVFPSVLAEGLPMVVLEAMAAGLPIVASRVDGVTDVLEDGVEGLLVPPAEPAALAAAVGRVVRGQVDWEGLRRRAFQRQAEQFSDRSMAAGVAAVYREVLGR
jgi:glycosyltransferase involved in cell wall biosynthesis